MGRRAQRRHDARHRCNVRCVRALLFAIGIVSVAGCVSWVPETLHEAPEIMVPLQSCYQASRFAREKVPVHATFGVTVGTDGSPSFVGIVKMNPRELELETCLVDQLLQKNYGFRYAEKCYIGTLVLADQSSLSVERSDSAWCRYPYVFPP